MRTMQLNMTSCFRSQKKSGETTPFS
uniref:Uncharacterized protein n=1 Tax=Anguilla anguilla TaxID=7936 RepID=A0A0E9U337_ANGAN